ncbi:MAG: cation-translocating P-type ATPase [Desulfobacteraceae bacterium]
MINKAWHSPPQEVLDTLQVTPDQGLDEREVKRRRHQYGPNRLKQAQTASAWVVLLRQFKGLISLLLLVATLVALAFGNWLEGVAVAVALLVNAAIGFGTELQAIRSMEALRQLTQVNAKVRRQAEVKVTPAGDLVPGDIVLLEGGDVVTADLRLIEASKFQANESTLTGESVPVSKQVEALAEEEVPLADRVNMVFKGTSVTRGSGEGVVVATGMDTELGKISSLVEEAEEEQTPLEKRLDRLGYKLIWLTLIIALGVAVTGLIADIELLLVIETSIALAVAAIPEGLPIVATISLAHGMRRMARRQALVNRLVAIETLGATNVILTDKTGTLTENRLTVARLASEAGELQWGPEADLDQDSVTSDKVLKKLLEVGILCNNASLSGQKSHDDHQAVGDPLEVALLLAGAQAGLERNQLLQEKPEVREESFDPQHNMMATFHQGNGYYLVAVKGAPEAVLNACRTILTPEDARPMDDKEKNSWLEVNNRLAQDGLRILALAAKEVDNIEAQPYEDLTFLGLMGLIDPPRQDIRPAIASCQQAGIRVIMVTGDHPLTARQVGLTLGLIDQKAEIIEGRNLKNPEQLSDAERQNYLQTHIFARVSPEQKLELVDLYQKNGDIVAMTGDGVNDAPALKKANIGIAMGQRGTQVACEAADIVLQDDSFSTILVAIQHGRNIFRNIRKFILFLLSGNVSEILIVTLAWLAGAPLPLLPLQILYLNMIGDVFPALALGVGSENPSLMQQPPRDPKESILTRRHWVFIGSYGILIAAVVLLAFGLAFSWLRLEADQAVTISFLTLAFARLWHVFNMRDPVSGLFRNDITRNPLIWGALALCTVLLLIAIYLPPLALALKLPAPEFKGWMLIIGMSLVPWVLGQLLHGLGLIKV